MAPVAGGFRRQAGFRDSEDVIRSLHLFLYLSFDSFCGWAFHIVDRIATGLGSNPKGREMLPLFQDPYLNFKSHGSI